MSTPAEPASETGNRGQTAIHYYLTIFRRRSWPIVACIVVPVLLAIAYSIAQKAEYNGSASVVLNRQSLANAVTNTPDPTAQANDYIRIVQTQAKLARSPEVAVRALADQPVRMSPEEFLQSSSVEPARDSDVLVFHVRNDNRQIARDLTNSYARAYVQFRLIVDTKALKEAKSAVDKRIRVLQSKPADNTRLIQSLQSRAQELETLQALQVAKATVVYDTELPAKVAPTLKRNLALGLLAGLALAIAIAALLESLDTRVRNDVEIAERLQGTHLARLGPPPSPDAGLIMLEKPSSIEAESFRVLETNIRFAMIDRPVKSLMVTSSLQGEGKSTTIANLAIAMARAGQNVVLLDLDLRRPSVRMMFDTVPGPGLTDVLLGSHPLDEAMQTVALEGADAAQGGTLRVIPAGTPPPNPGELLSPNGKVSKLIKVLEDQADIVLVDAPPALVVGDAVALTAIVDAVFAVVRLRLVTRPMLDELDRALGVGRAHVLGFVVTGRLSRSGGGYGYGYGYGHTYDPTPQHASAS